jgi:hypothetical protein
MLFSQTIKLPLIFFNSMIKLMASSSFCEFNLILSLREGKSVFGKGTNRPQTLEPGALGLSLKVYYLGQVASTGPERALSASHPSGAHFVLDLKGSDNGV